MPDAVVVQISDSHIGGAWPGADPTQALTATLDEIRGMADRPDAVLVTGDLTNTGTPSETELVAGLLGQLEVPVRVLPGNHDDRGRLREHFPLPGADGTPAHYTADFGALRVVALDTTVPGETAGRLDGTRLSWLEAELTAAPERPTLVAMHHPPISTGVHAWDEIGLPAADRAALGELVRRHPQVRRLVAGHVHQAIHGELGGCQALTAPSTCVQARLNLTAPQIELAAHPPGFAVHALADGAAISYTRFLN